MTETPPDTDDLTKPWWLLSNAWGNLWGRFALEVNRV